MGSRKRKKKKKHRKSRKQRAKLPGEGRDFRYHTVFVGGKQKRIREPLIDGVPVDEWERQNADPIYLKQNEMWEELHELYEREMSESEYSADTAETFPREPDTEGTLPSAVDNHSPPSEKIELFRSLFRGRRDVYARRFESRTSGKSGYAPACGNEWVRGVCEKPRVKCAECAHRRFLPVDDESIRWHLTGRDDRGSPFVMGVYPMLEDENCWFLAIDFDKADWMRDSTAFLETCRRRQIPAALERSRSGKAGMSGFSSPPRFLVGSPGSSGRT